MIGFHRSCLFDVTWGAKLCQHELRPSNSSSAVGHLALLNGLVLAGCLFSTSAALVRGVNKTPVCEGEESREEKSV